MAKPEIVQGQVHGVEKRGVSLGATRNHVPLEPSHVSCETLRDPWPIVELNQEVLIVGVPGFQKGACGRTSGIELTTHASAHVEDQTQAHRCVLGGKVLDLLLDLVLPNLKILGVQAL